MSPSPKVAVIVLNYNSWKDTVQCVSLCLRQSYPDFLVIVVDNASSDGSLEKMRAAWRSGETVKCLAEYNRRDAEAGGTEEKENKLEKYGGGERLVLIKNDENFGYAAGNNVGLRYAVKIGVDAVLLLNPDVLIEDKDVVKIMMSTLFASENSVAVGPKVIDRKGRLQNPLYEPTFVGEAFLPYIGIVRDVFWNRVMMKMSRRLLPIEVSKIVGCCILLKANFIEDISLLDESTFLYCEEAILAAQARIRRKKIIYEPRATVKHLHQRTNGNINIFFKSRQYYLKTYKNYGSIKMTLVRITQGLIKMKYVILRIKRFKI